MINFKPYPYQTKAIDWILDKPKAGLFLDMGLGKTISTLMAVSALILMGEVKKVLVIAPLRVASSVWPSEIEKWKEVSHLRISVALGPEKKRLKALDEEADIYVINRENVKWLVDKTDWDYDMVVIDELSSFKSPSSQRFRALRKVIHKAKRVVGLTGTPAPNSLQDLWPEMYLIDQGERLGPTVTGFRNKYFLPGLTNGYVVYTYWPKKGAKEEIERRIADVCISMTKEDYLDLPDVIYQDIPIKLSRDEKDDYEKLERDCILELEGEKILALNAAAANTKLQQLANGEVYSPSGTVHLHNRKLEALEQLIEEANGKSVLVFYAYKHDKDRILARFTNARVLENEKDIEDWNKGEIPILLAHPASSGHGLNLQDGGHIIIWFGLTWSLELYQQANARLHRNGQAHPVTVFHLITQDSVDEACMRAIKRKDKGQQALIDYLKAKKEGVKNDSKRISKTDKKSRCSYRP